MDDEALFAMVTKGVHKPKKHKLALFLCGSAGSGKTTSRSLFLKDAGVTTSYVYLNVDDLKDYTKSPQEALLKLTERVVSEGYSFFWDATCRNKTTVLPWMEYLKQKGYRVVMGITYASLPTVLKRVKERISQPIPEHVVRDIYQHVVKNIEVYMDHVDDVYLYNNESKIKLIFYKADKVVHCISPDSKFYFDVSKYC